MRGVRPEDVTGTDWTWHPERVSNGPVSIVLSGADRQAWIFQNGEPLGRAGLTFATGYELPRGVFSYVGVRNGDRRWVAAGLSAAAANGVLDEMRDRVGVAPEFLRAVQNVLRPGDTLVVTPHSLVPPSVAAAPIE
jgi:hypothetical protein